ncbi:hypothetical protein OYC64_010080 [Pagothenia borchgrevinki]|uniref:Sterile alpha motif domain-containing 3-like n=1 Tax=Pagothenia borchgrevinki TaxID=8213 RepID=A0ABD2H8C2_PAGBO
MGEDPKDLVREYVGTDEGAIKDTTVGIYVLKDASTDEPEDIGIVLEGVKVMTNLDNVASAFVMLFGLMYVLNFSYPADLRYTFEVVQSIFMELDCGKLSNKATALKNRLLQ